MAWIVASLVVGGALGTARAFSTKIWRVQDGSAMSQGTVLTAVLWVVSLGAHLAMEVGIDHSTKIAGLGPPVSCSTWQLLSASNARCSGGGQGCRRSVPVGDLASRENDHPAALPSGIVDTSTMLQAATS